jgi:hypothetical protein
MRGIERAAGLQGGPEHAYNGFHLGKVIGRVGRRMGGRYGRSWRRVARC